MEIKANVNANLDVDTGHFSEILRSFWEMTTTKIVIISAAVVLTALIFNLDKVEGIIRAVGF